MFCYHLWLERSLFFAPLVDYELLDSCFMDDMMSFSMMITGMIVNVQL